MKAKYHYPEFTYHDGLLLRAAIDARERAKNDLATRGANALALDAVVAVVMAAAAAESFANELPGRIRVAIRRGVKVPVEFISCADAIDALETRRRATTAKYQAAAEHISGKRFAERKPPFRDVVLLFELRNSVMHAKPVPDRRLIAIFKQRKLTTDVRFPVAENVVGLTWMDRLLDPAIAEWACSAAHRMILAVLEMIEKKQTDVLDTVTKWFRDKNKFPTDLR